MFDINYHGPNSNWNGRFTFEGTLFDYSYTMAFFPRVYFWKVGVFDFDEETKGFEVCFGPFFEFIIT